MSSLRSDGSTSSTILRCYAPPVLAEPYRLAFSGIGSAGEQLGRRLAFLETLGRFLVAGLAAECVAVGLALPNRFDALARRLHKPTLGLWFEAAESLANLLRERDYLVVPELPRVLLESDGTPTNAYKALENLIAYRNESSHDPHGAVASGAHGESALRDLEPKFSAVLGALRFLRTTPMFVAQPGHSGLVCGQECTVLRFRGADVDPIPLKDLKEPIPAYHPFFVGPSGRLLFLSPFLVYATFGGLKQRQLRLLEKWREGGPAYTDPHGYHTELWQDREETEENVRAFFGRYLRPDVQRAPRVDEEQLRQLQDRQAGEQPPRLAGYDIQVRLGQGASSTVYLATSHAGSPGQVAIKALKRELVSDPQQRRRLRHEYATMAKLNVPAIAKVYELVDDGDGVPCLVMEYIEGTDLERLVRLERLSVDAATSRVIEVLQALDKPHRERIVHRDIKPSNLLVDPAGRLRIIDFGIALNPDQTRLTQLSDGVGTPAFAAPEQLDGQEADMRSDIYAVGRLLGYLVTGKTERDIHLDVLPPALGAVYRRATDKNPVARYPDVTQMAAALLNARLEHWNGAPVGEGAMLADSLLISRAVGRVAPGLFAFEGLNVLQQSPVGLLVATAEGVPLLLTAQRQCPAALRQALGNPQVQRDADGLHYCLLVADDVKPRALEFVKCAEQQPEAPAPPPPDPAPVPPSSGSVAGKAAATAAIVGAAGAMGVVGLGLAALMGKKLLKPTPAPRPAVSPQAPPATSSPPPANAPAYLSKIMLPLATAPAAQHAKTAHLLALVLYAQAAAHGWLPLDLPTWRQFQVRLLTPARILTHPGRALVPGGARHPLNTLRDTHLNEQVALLDQVARGAKEATPGRLAAARQLNELFQAVSISLDQGLHSARLAPWLQPTPRGWAWLATTDGKNHLLPLKN